MPVSEFSLIEKYFNRPKNSISESSVILGIGDDAAILKVPDKHQLVVTIDTLIAGRHFPESTPARDIAYKALAVNVSDLAAMAATPAYFVLSLTLPESDETFLKQFSDGLFEAAEEFNILLVGGDTCRGPLSITIQASGYVPDDGYITRSGAQPGDHIMVSGELGAAAVGLACLTGETELDPALKLLVLESLNRPIPRIDLIPVLREYATSAIDLSDGLVGDLAHILEKSQVGASLKQDSIPVFESIKHNDSYNYALTGGDDYELLFTVSENKVAALMQSANNLSLDITDIGVITEQGYWMHHQGNKIDLSSKQGFDHFGS